MACPTVYKTQWTPWSEKSSQIDYDNITNGVGKGEYKVAAELNTTVLGQNSSYDMTITIDEVIYQADVKQLDCNTFNTGRNGRDILRPIKEDIQKLIQLLNHLSPESFFDADEIYLINRLKVVSSDELAVRTIQDLKKLIDMLHIKKQELTNTLRTITLYNIITGKPFETTLYKAYCVSKICGETLPLESEELEKVKLIDLLDHPYIDSPDLLHIHLQSLKTIFKDTALIFVDKEKGYIIVKNPLDCIVFERITRGNPRFRYIS